MRDLGKFAATEYLREAYDECMLAYAEKEQRRLREIPKDPVVPKPNPPPPPPVDEWKQSTPVANSWNNPNRIQQLHCHHQQIVENRDRHAQMHDTHMHQNHRGDFNIHHQYPRFQHIPVHPPHNHQDDYNQMGNPFPQQYRQPPGWGNGARTWKENSDGPTGQGGK